MKIIRTEEPAFAAAFHRIRQRGKVFDKELWRTVQGIVDDVAANGDAALFAYAEKFDGVFLNAGTVAATSEEIETALDSVSPADWQTLRLAAARIEKFHRLQEVPSWLAPPEAGIELGQRVMPLERIAVYAPGGRAVYPSTVLMAAIPARVAGVTDIFLATPSKSGVLHPLIAAAAHLGGVTRIFKIGGAQAIAALAYGTASVPAVDKIVGPGNAYVAAAKKLVFGQVAIDMIAGPSEVLIVADETANAAHAAADLLAQAEHDVMTSAVLLTPSAELARQVAGEVARQLPRLSRREVAQRSLDDFGILIVTKDMAEAVALANRFAPEHLELLVAAPAAVLKEVKNAGAVFLGGNTPETLGDYIAGPNHILPTSSTARFSSPLGVYDFVKRTSILNFSPEALKKYGPEAARFAELEGFDAHAHSVMLRLQPKKA
ncbi:MAG: histidinol dehydrogenase [Syntrophales bacterium]